MPDRNAGSFAMPQSDGEDDGIDDFDDDNDFGL